MAILDKLSENSRYIVYNANRMRMKKACHDSGVSLSVFPTFRDLNQPQQELFDFK